MQKLQMTNGHIRSMNICTTKQCVIIKYYAVGIVKIRLMTAVKSETNAHDFQTRNTICYPLTDIGFLNTLCANTKKNGSAANLIYFLLSLILIMTKQSFFFILSNGMNKQKKTE